MLSIGSRTMTGSACRASTRRLAAAFVAAHLGLTLAAAGFQSVVTSLGYDAITPKRRRLVSASLRLALTRWLAILSIAAIGALLTLRAVDTSAAVILAIVFWSNSVSISDAQA